LRVMNVDLVIFRVQGLLKERLVEAVAPDHDVVVVLLDLIVLVQQLGVVTIVVLLVFTIADADDLKIRFRGLALVGGDFIRVT